MFSFSDMFHQNNFEQYLFTTITLSFLAIGIDKLKQLVKEVRTNNLLIQSLENTAMNLYKEVTAVNHLIRENLNDNEDSDSETENDEEDSNSPNISFSYETDKNHIDIIFEGPREILNQIKDNLIIRPTEEIDNSSVSEDLQKNYYALRFVTKAKVN
jgi:hypothetical protein